MEVISGQVNVVWATVKKSAAENTCMFYNAFRSTSIFTWGLFVVVDAFFSSFFLLSSFFHLHQCVCFVFTCYLCIIQSAPRYPLCTPHPIGSLWTSNPSHSSSSRRMGRESVLMWTSDLFPLPLGWSQRWKGTAASQWATSVTRVSSIQWRTCWMDRFVWWRDECALWCLSWLVLHLPLTCLRGFIL